MRLREATQILRCRLPEKGEARGDTRPGARSQQTAHQPGSTNSHCAGQPFCPAFVCPGPAGVRFALLLVFSAALLSSAVRRERFAGGDPADPSLSDMQDEVLRL